MSDAIAPDRLEALLRGEAGTDGRERRIGALLDELTVGEIAAPAELRERVRSLTVAPAEVAPAPRGGCACRGACGSHPVLGIAAVAAVIAGVAATQSAPRRRDAPSILKAQSQDQPRRRGRRAPATARRGAHGDDRAASPPRRPRRRPPRPRRARTGSARRTTPASLSSRSAASPSSRARRSRARPVHALGGAVETVEYGTPSRGRGSAVIDLRVPVGRAQEALRRFSSLGTITAQQVQIRDLQGGLDQETNRARALRRRVELLKAKLLSPTLTAEDRAVLEGRLADAQTALESVLRGVHATQQRAAFAHFSLALVTGRGTPVAPPRSPARSIAPRTTPST